MKRIAIIGAGISGLFVANLFQKNKNYQISIYEKKDSIDLNKGYGIQLSSNCIKLLNKLSFNTLDKDEVFNPTVINFFQTNKEIKICDLDITKFNDEDCKYSSLKRSTLSKFLVEKLDSHVIKFNHEITEINNTDHKISLSFKQGDVVNCDYLIIADGVFSKCKSLLSSNKIKPKFNNSIAIRGLIDSEHLPKAKRDNVSISMGSNFHYVVYPVDNKGQKTNFIGILKEKLTQDQLINYKFFDQVSYLNSIKEKLKNKISINILENLQDLKIFPVFVSEEFYKSEKNIFCLGDAFFAYPPSFAQGASQSIESAFELYKDIIDEKNNFYNNRIIKSKRVNLRSKLNQFAFHISNPLLVYIRNFVLKILVKNKKFLDSYLGKVYKN